MTGRIRKLLVLAVVLIGIISTQSEVMAQDSGPPALRTLAFYTVGGAAGGALLGIAYWALDPLAPSADLRASSLQGMGIGVFGGFAFGVLMLNQQAKLLYRQELPTDEFQGNNAEYYNRKFLYSLGPAKKKPADITLFNYQLKF
jgi:hypothetical protein